MAEIQGGLLAGEPLPPPPAQEQDDLPPMSSERAGEMMKQLFEEYPILREFLKAGIKQKSEEDI